MQAEDINPHAELAIDASAIVSETDAAHSSEDEDHDWLSSSNVHSERCRLSRVDEIAHASENDEQLHDEDTEDDEINENEIADELYCKNMDDEDEAWVYKHLRGGNEEAVYVRSQQIKVNGGSESIERRDNAAMEEHDTTLKGELHAELDTTRGQTQVSLSHHEQMQKALLLKPRDSDAVLSCPRCFTTVCMDCQQHEKYANQYRAMFVMNIGVDWNKTMVYDDALGGLKLASRRSNNGDEAHALPNTIPHDMGNDATDQDSEQFYYSVHCGYCACEVAALDMKDEVYYFYGCIASG